MLKYIGVGRNHLGGCPRVETAPRWPSVSSSFLLCHCFHGLSILSSTVEALDSKGGGFFFLQQLLAEMKSYVKQVRSSSDSIIHLSLFIWRSLWRVNGRTWLNFTGLYTDWWFSVFFFGDLDLWLSLGEDFLKLIERSCSSSIVTVLSTLLWVRRGHRPQTHRLRAPKFSHRFKMF